MLVRPARLLGLHRHAGAPVSAQTPGSGIEKAATATAVVARSGSCSRRAVVGVVAEIRQSLAELERLAGIEPAESATRPSWETRPQPAAETLADGPAGPRATAYRVAGEILRRTESFADLQPSIGDAYIHVSVFGAADTDGNAVGAMRRIAELWPDGAVEVHAGRGNLGDKLFPTIDVLIDGIKVTFQASIGDGLGLEAARAWAAELGVEVQS